MATPADTSGATLWPRPLPQAVWAFILLAPALALVAALFLLPLVRATELAFTQADGSFGFGNFVRVFDLYLRNILFTTAVVVGSVLVSLAGAILISSWLTLGTNHRVVSLLAWISRVPLFVPFICVGPMMAGFLAKNGLFNNSIAALGLMDPIRATSMLDWRGLVFAFSWKQLPFIVLLLAGAMAAIDRSQIEAARNLGASRARIVLLIILPQVTNTLIVASVLSFVSVISVLSVPLIIGGETPSMIMVDIAYRVRALGDYGTANALGVVSYLMTAALAWLYLRTSARQKETG